MFDFSEKKKAQVYDNLRSVMQICMERIVKHNKDGKGKQDAEALRNDFAYAFHCMDLCSEYRWIPVAERLPEGWQTVLIVLDNGRQVVVDYEGSGFVTDDEFFSLGRVSAWMPLPEPPEV